MTYTLGEHCCRVEFKVGYLTPSLDSHERYAVLLY